MLASKSSLEALNSQLKNNEIEIHQFRPNFVVDGSQAHDEDNWKIVKIGNTIFEVVLPCTRYIVLKNAFEASLNVFKIAGAIL